MKFQRFGVTRESWLRWKEENEVIRDVFVNGVMAHAHVTTKLCTLWGSSTFGFLLFTRIFGPKNVLVKLLKLLSLYLNIYSIQQVFPFFFHFLERDAIPKPSQLMLCGMFTAWLFDFGEFFTSAAFRISFFRLWPCQDLALLYIFTVVKWMFSSCRAFCLPSLICLGL